MPVAGVALVLALAASPALERWTVDAPLILTASAPASSVETILLPWAAIRGGRLWDLSGALAGFSGGLDVSLWAGGYETEGTPDVSATRFFTAAEGRGLLGWRAVHSTYAALTPFAFAGLRGGGGPSIIDVFEDGRVGLLPLWGARLGAGADLTIHHVLVRSELGAGVRDGRFELTSGVSLGAVF